MNTQQLKKLIAEEIHRIKENGPAVAPSKPKTAPGVKPPKEKPKVRRPLTPPKEAPKTRPKAEGKINENEEQIVNQIVKRFKSK